MDAVQKSFTSSVLFLATAALLSVPAHATTAPTLSVGVSSVTIGSSSCNNSQAVTVATSDTTQPVQFSVAVRYPNGTDPTKGDANGAWLYATVSGSGTTSTATTFNANTGPNGATLTIGLNRSIGAVSDTGEVDITNLTNPSDTPIKLTVFYTQNTSCGGNTGSATNGFIILTPGSVSLSAASGTASQTLSIQNTTGSVITFTPTVNPTGSWLSVSYNSTTVSASGGTTPVTVIADASKVSSGGTYNGIVTITPCVSTSPCSGAGAPVQLNVTFTAGSGGGGGGGGTSGTLTVNGATATTYSTSFNEIGGSAPGALCVPIQDTAAGANSYTYSASTTSGGNWLLANFNLSGTTPQLLAPSYNACVTISTSNVANTLASGTYQGSVSLTSSSGSTAAINVTLNVSGGAAPGISVSPGLVYTFPNQNQGSTTLQQQVFTISTTAAGIGFGTATPVNSNGCTTSSAWFSMTNPTASGNTETFTVTANPTGLSSGYYCQVISMSSTGNGTLASGTTYITVVLPIGQGTGGGGGGGGTTTQSLVAPTALTFLQQAGTSFWTSGREQQAITITGAPGTQWSAAIVYGSSGSNWLTFANPATGSGTFGSTGLATLVMDLYNGVGSLSASNNPYNATINITTPSGTSQVNASVLVTPSNTPVLLGLPATTTFSASSGTTPTSQVVQVVGSDNTGSGTTPPITVGTPSASWLTASSNGGNSMTLNVSATGLSTGLYYATVPVSATAYPNGLTYPVVLIVNGGGGGTVTGPLSLSSTSLSFTSVTASISSNVNITATNSTNVTVTSSEQSCTSQTWLSITPTSFTASTTNTPLNVTVNPSGINNGTTCTGTITLTTGSGTQTVSVSMGVGNATGSGNVTVSPTSMQFSYTTGQSVPGSQTATIVNATSGTPGIPFTVTTSAGWLQVNATQGSTPYNSPGLAVSVAPGSLQASSTPYSGTVTITPTGGSAQTINVSLTVNSNAVVTATVLNGTSSTSSTLTYNVGGTAPSGTIQVSGGGSAANFTATATSSSNFLTVTPTSGTTPNTGTTNLTIGVNPTVLATLLPNTYTGTITVAGASPATGTTNIQVTLQVVQPLPQITGVYNSASFASGAVSPGELISIFADPAHPIGPSTAYKLDSTTCPGSCTRVPTSMGGVQVKFLPNGVLAPLIYVSAGQINAIVPYEEAGIANLSVEVLFLGQTSNAFPVNLAVTAPGIFTQPGSGTGPAAANQYDTSGTFQGENMPSKPAGKGWLLVLYMTGEGLVSPGQPSQLTGSVTPSTGTIPVPGFAPTVLIGNQPANVVYYGEASGLVSGVLQVNVIVPSSAPSGNAVPISVSIGPNSSQAGTTVAIQ